MRNMSEEARKNKKAYDTKYILKNIVQKRINFNTQVPEDVKMLDWVEQQENQNQYMKSLIADDMNKSGG